MKPPTAKKPAKELTVVPKEEPISMDDMERLEEAQLWTYYGKQLAVIDTKAQSILTADPLLPATSKAARANRLEFKNFRIEVENKRKELTEYFLTKKQNIDNEARKIRLASEEMEGKLLAIEQYAERVEAERKNKLGADRLSELAEVGFTALPLSALSLLKDEEYADMLAGAKLAQQAKIAQAKQEEAARLAKEKADAEEREKTRLENEKLKAEAQAMEKEQAEERKKFEAQAKQQREEAEKVRAEAERVAAAERKKVEDKAKAEREARIKAEEALAAAKKLEQDKLEAEEAERQRQSAAPDKEKVQMFADQVRALQFGGLTSKKGKAVEADIQQKIIGFAGWLEGRIALL